MDKWGRFSFSGYATTSEIEAKFAEYGITVTHPSNQNNPHVYFSDEPTVDHSMSQNMNYKEWLVNDSKHVIHAINNHTVPYNSSSDISIIELFKCGIYPLITGGEIIVNETTNYGGGIYQYLSIWEDVTETDPSAQDLILVPVCGKVRQNSDYYNNLFFKDLYFCYQRQFKTGDIVKASNGDKYISFGGWLLFKM